MDVGRHTAMKQSGALLVSAVAIATQLAVIVGLLVAYYVYPVSWARLVAEDNVGEFSTAFAMLFAALLFAIAMYRGPFRNYWYGLLALGTFFIGMEEISWGQRLLDVATPENFAKVNSQRELTLHNIPGVEPGPRTYLFASLVFLGYGVLLPLAHRFVEPVRSLTDWARLPVARLHLMPIFLVTAYFLAMSPRVAPLLLPVISPMAKAVEVSELLMAISLGALAVDEVLRHVYWRRDESQAPSWWLPALVAAPLLWLVAAIFAVPSLIEAAYHGRSLPIFNQLITNKVGDPLSYYLDTWGLVTWVVLLNLVLFEVALVLGRRYRPEPRGAGMGWPMAASAALPVFYLVSFVISASLSSVSDGKFNLAGRLNDHLALRLPALGHYEQAEKIVAFLEQNPEYADRELWINKASLLARMQQPEQAKRAYEHAMLIELERLEENPDSSRILRRLGIVHAELGNSAVAAGFFQRSLDRYIAEIEGTDSPDRIGRLYAERARVFVDMREHNLAIADYLRASQLATNAEFQILLSKEIRHNLASCGMVEDYRPEVDGVHRQELDWDAVEAMSSQLSGGADVRWCPQAHAGAEPIRRAKAQPGSESGQSS